MHHHYVPQFLLRAWAENTFDKKIEVFHLDQGRLTFSRLTPKYTGYEEDLYALSKPVVAGIDKQAIEKQLLMRIDNSAARVRLMLEGQGLRGLSVEDRMDWARFLMSLRLRQPAIVDELRQGAAEHLRKSLAAQPEQYEELAGLENPPTLEEWTEKNYPGLIENFGMSFFHELVDNPRIGTKIISMKWWMWDFSDVPFDLLLADHPCIFTSGIDNKNIILALPISPKRAFMATQEERVADTLRRQRPRDLAARLNESSVGQAVARVYARDRSPQRFILNRLHRRFAAKG